MTKVAGDGHIVFKVKDSSGTTVSGPHILDVNTPTHVVDVPAGGYVRFTDPADANDKGAAGTFSAP